MHVALLRASLFWRGGRVMQRAAGSQSRRTDLFTGMHRWACFCNTKALLLVSPFPSTWSALHPNALQAKKPARRWLGSTEAEVQREREAAGRTVLITPVCMKRPEKSLAIPHTHSFCTHFHFQNNKELGSILMSGWSTGLLAGIRFCW